MDRIYSRPGYLIRRAQQVADAAFMNECREFDLTPVQYASLVAISENPDIDATRLSALISLDRSTLGSVLERLLAKRLILRTHSKKDKRIKLVQITKEGAQLLQAAEPSVERAQNMMLASLTAADRKKFLEMLIKIGSDAKS